VAAEAEHPRAARDPPPTVSMNPEHERRNPTGKTPGRQVEKTASRHSNVERLRDLAPAGVMSRRFNSSALASLVVGVGTMNDTVPGRAWSCRSRRA